MSETSDVSWKDYVDMRFSESDKRVADALAANEKRLDGMNEFRQTISDNAAKFITLETYNAHHKALMDKVELLEKQATFGGGRIQGGRERTNNIYAAAAFVVGIVGTVLATGVLK